MVISIGAGIEEKFVKGHSKGMTWEDLFEFGPHGLATGLKTLLQMSQATLNCERQWAEFANYSSGNEELSSRYQRLNIVLPQKPCKLDDVAALPGLEKEAEDFLDPNNKKSYDPRYHNCDAQLSSIAAKLLSTLFYLNVTRLSRKQHSQNEWHVEGQLRCRLKYSYLAEFESLLGGNTRGLCIFRVRSRYGNAKILSVKRSEWNMEKFMINVDFTIEARHEKIWIEQGFEYEHDWNAISGFPRLLEVRKTSLSRDE